MEKKSVIISAIVLLAVVLVTTGLLLTKKCGLSTLDSGRNSGGCHFIWQKSWWTGHFAIEQKLNPASTSNDTINKPIAIIKQNNLGTSNIMKEFLNFSAEYINLSPSIVKLGEEKSVTQIPNLKLTLVDVVSEGRCPENVNCGHAGWATVKVTASYQGVVETKELNIFGGRANVFSPPRKASNDWGVGNGNILSIDQYQIFLVGLYPYPNTTVKFNKNDFEAVLVADSNKNLELKRAIVAVAQDELKQRLTDANYYYPVGISPNTDESVKEYTVTFRTTSNTSEQDVFVKVHSVNNFWTAI